MYNSWAEKVGIPVENQMNSVDCPQLAKTFLVGLLFSFFNSLPSKVHK